MDSVEESLRKFLRSSDFPLFQEDREKNRKRLNFSCFHYFNYTNEDADALWLNIQVTWEICWKISKVKITREVDLWAGKRWQLLRWEMGRRIEERLGKGLKRKMGTKDGDERQVLLILKRNMRLLYILIRRWQVSHFLMFSLVVFSCFFFSSSFTMIFNVDVRMRVKQAQSSIFTLKLINNIRFYSYSWLGLLFESQT